MNQLDNQSQIAKNISYSKNSVISCLLQEDQLHGIARRFTDGAITCKPFFSPKHFLETASWPMLKLMRKNKIFITLNTSIIHTAKTPQTCCKLSILLVVEVFNSTSFDFTKLQQMCQNQACCNLPFADLLQLIETARNKPVDDKFWHPTSNWSVDNLQHIFFLS